MDNIGTIRKMRVVGVDDIQYYLPLGDKEILINDYIGKDITITHTGKINCLHCKRSIKKTYQSGYCFVCATSLAQCDMCIMKPELCHYAEGTCREPEWGDKHCNTDHILYLAYSSGVKIGLTRITQVPIRWVDQGAMMALPIMRIKTRHICGLIEKFISEFMNDKTNWRKMLTMLNNVDETNNILLESRAEVFSKTKDYILDIENEFGEKSIILLEDEVPLDIRYPITVDELPLLKSKSLAKNPEITGKLVGIKGQYLLLDTGVINIRSNAGYEIKFV